MCEMCEETNAKSDLPPRRNIKLVIGYNGAAYHGWQRQADGIITVQQQIEDVATRVMKHRVILFGAGRTDAGVHASGQVANFYTQNFRIPPDGIRRAITSRLQHDIVLHSANEVDEKFHASRSAVGKTYRYRLHVGPTRPVELNKQVYHYYKMLDVDSMRRAAGKLIGTHDFRGLASAAEIRDNTVRTIYRCDVSSHGQEIHVSVQGNGFLYNMVRNLVGTLTEIGRGHWTPDRIDMVLATRDRKAAGPCLPPDGLSMVCVHYDGADLAIDG